MKAKIQAENPDSIEFTLTLTYSLGSWKKLKESIEHEWQYPQSDLIDAIRDMTTQAEREFYPADKTNERATGR